jgi:hypothetical protein
MVGLGADTVRHRPRRGKDVAGGAHDPRGEYMGGGTGRASVHLTRAAAAACLLAMGLAAGCGNTRAVCADTEKTLEDFAARTRTLPPADPAQWQRAITDVAGRLDALARRADSGKLRSALRETAASYRAAAAGMARGDTAGLSAAIRDQAARLDRACR